MLHRLLLTLLIGFAPLVEAGIGDVYFCTTTDIHDVRDGELTSYNQQKFKFKWNENSIDFGQGGSYFDKMSEPLVGSYSSLEHFRTQTNFNIIYFAEGRFRFITTSNTDAGSQHPEAMIIIANCDKF